MPTIAKFRDATNILNPSILITHAARYVFFLPQLSAIYAMIMQPRNEPKQDRDCNREDSHLLWHSIIIPQSNEIEDGIGGFKCSCHCYQVKVQTYYQQDWPGYSSDFAHQNYGVMQKKFRENKIMPASNHFKQKLTNNSVWYLGVEPLLTRVMRISPQCF